MKKIIILVVILVILAGGGFFAYQTFFKSDDAQAKEKETVDVATLVETRVTMEPITTHLVSPTDYIIIALDVQTSSLEAKEEFELRLGEMKSVAITSFNAMKEDELRGEGGTKSLMETIKKEFNEIMSTGEVTDIFITDYKLQ